MLFLARGSPLNQSLCPFCCPDVPVPGPKHQLLVHTMSHEIDAIGGCQRIQAEYALGQS